MTADASVETTIEGRWGIAKVRGAMDFITSPALWEQLKQALTSGGRCLVVDLSEVSFCDSAGLNLLLRTNRHARLDGVELILAALPRPLRQIVELTGADQILRVYHSVADAEAAVGHRGDAPGPLA
ncbi:STAS domain-containing protein [Streptomyces sp. NPDC047072]|uniref:STAS domain-containing protein n=1 Tax=Streptomyces sp. NPDC047072 TaxID=3154809 RepID=UPI0033EDBCE6